MNANVKREFVRRDLLRLGMAGASSALIGSQLPASAFAVPIDLKNKRRARYQANSPEVRHFYRVNRYPSR
jgi:hypothetical protein